MAGGAGGASQCLLGDDSESQFLSAQSFLLHLVLRVQSMLSGLSAATLPTFLPFHS